ncbi:MAG TPA: hypothetical protein VGB70_08055 [Allosphingosinicella sp.]|jgi:hypothetical protein
MHLTLGHVLYIVAGLCALYGLTQFALSMRYTGAAHGAGTPGYARHRDAQRFTIWGGALGLAFLLLAQLTPLGDVALG